MFLWSGDNGVVLVVGSNDGGDIGGDGSNRRVEDDGVNARKKVEKA